MRQEIVTIFKDGVPYCVTQDGFNRVTAVSDFLKKWKDLRVALTNASVDYKENQQFSFQIPSAGIPVIKAHGCSFDDKIYIEVFDEDEKCYFSTNKHLINVPIDEIVKRIIELEHQELSKRLLAALRSKELEYKVSQADVIVIQNEIRSLNTSVEFIAKRLKTLELKAEEMNGKNFNNPISEFIPNRCCCEDKND